MVQSVFGDKSESNGHNRFMFVSKLNQLLSGRKTDKEVYLKSIWFDLDD